MGKQTLAEMMNEAQDIGIHRLGPAPRGYAFPPGTGPAGETCGTCAHLVRKQMSKRYYKCGLRRREWTGGAATDVSVKSPACAEWASSETKPGEPKS